MFTTKDIMELIMSLTSDTAQVVDTLTHAHTESHNSIEREREQRKSNDSLIANC